MSIDTAPKMVEMKHGSAIRHCPCCAQLGEEFISPYHLDSSSINHSQSKYRFFHHPLYCQHCGHVWNSTQPAKDELYEYYLDQLPHVNESYSSEVRIDTIRKLTEHLLDKSFSQLTLLDYGSNQSLLFHSLLEKSGIKITTYDIGAQLIDTTQKYDVVSCYFMLEHALDLDEHFEVFREKLDVGSFLLIEVPDTGLYEKDYSGLLYEHQQHFQLASLDTLARKHGFSPITDVEISCSRPCGFVRAYQMKNVPTSEREAVIDVRQVFKIARKEQIKLEELVSKIATKIKVYVQTTHSNKTYIWGVNDYYLAIREKLDELIPVSEASLYIGIDINSEKRHFVYSQDNFLNTEQAVTSLELENENSVLMITASRHWRQIIKGLNFKGNIIVFEPFDISEPIREFTL